MPFVRGFAERAQVSFSFAISPAALESGVPFP
jgi:hypothetical protein